MRTLLLTVLLLATAMTSSAAEPASPSGESRFVTVDGLKVHYTSYGGADATVVLVHGWTCDETTWSRNVPVLAQQARVITIDLPGHGQSEKPQIAYTMDLHARAVAAVMRDAKVKSAALVGHSFGAAVIRQVYRLHPELVRSLVIVDGALRPFGDQSMMEKFVEQLRGPNYEKNAGRSIDGMTHLMSDTALRAEIKATVLKTPQHVAVSTIEGTLEPSLWAPDKIDVPVLMILTTSPMWTSDYEQFARSFIPTLEYEKWPHVTHFLMMEKPREFSEAVLAFLQKHLVLPERS